MIAKDPPSARDDGSDAWMALPLFNRKGSPDHTRNILAWQPPTSIDLDMPNLDYGFFDYDIMDYDTLTPSYASESSRPQSDFAISAFHLNASSYFADSSRPHSASFTPALPYDTPSQSPGISRPHSVSVSSTVQSDSGYESIIVEQASSSKRRSLLNEISDDHIPQPAFTGPCQCTFENCKSTTVFTTGRDFRRHYRQHFKRFFCRYEECPQSTDDPGDAGTRGFATRKDRARHEAKHNPAIKCPWQSRNGGTCTRTFSRMDNMRDHYRRIHGKSCKT
ncbi:Tri6 [Stachybotrys chlorohalonatus IBT 40285]|uniref:Tri6 n=1 Tax=Stachybotrys chlorohalonatus (strain IBT 40285) TaxID=1283841 RepID=A0A084QY33_STAC4|nr:Tri6 [Stachybotrys chlorohalonata IBT 40285]